MKYGLVVSYPVLLVNGSLMVSLFFTGGIVTFTPAAISRDPIGVRNLIIQISRHPLWACYVLPVVVGAAAAEQCGPRNPLDLLSK